MKRKINIAALLLLLGTAAHSHAQNLVQPMFVNLTIFDTVGNRTINVQTTNFINYIMGTNVPNGKLFLVTPMGNAPGTLGALGAWLRIKSGATTIYEVPSVSQFNIYQDVSILTTTSTKITARALNRFSFDTGAVRAELQGFSTWTIWRGLIQGQDVTGTGTFTCRGNGWMDIYNVTHGSALVQAQILAREPIPGP